MLAIETVITKNETYEEEFDKSLLDTIISTKKENEASKAKGKEIELATEVKKEEMKLAAKREKMKLTAEAKKRKKRKEVKF